MRLFKNREPASKSQMPQDLKRGKFKRWLLYPAFQPSRTTGLVTDWWQG